MLFFLTLSVLIPSLLKQHYLRITMPFGWQRSQSWWFQGSREPQLLTALCCWHRERLWLITGIAQVLSRDLASSWGLMDIPFVHLQMPKKKKIMLMLRLCQTQPPQCSLLNGTEYFLLFCPPPFDRLQSFPSLKGIPVYVLILYKCADVLLN